MFIGYAATIIDLAGNKSDSPPNDIIRFLVYEINNNYLPRRLRKIVSDVSRSLSLNS